MTARIYTIGILGGTGNLGNALAARWAKAGHRVILGSRDAAKARQRAEEMSTTLGTEIRFGSNQDTAEQAEIIVLAVPFANQTDAIEEVRPALAGKILLDTTVPLLPPKVMRVQMPAEGSAAQRAQLVAGENVRVVSAFHNVAAHKLASAHELEGDVLVFGDDLEARKVVVELANATGLRGLHAGALANSVAAEALTSVLIFMNKHYAADGAGIRITGELDAGKLG